MQEFQDLSKNVRLSGEQQKAILPLLGNHTIAEVANQIGITERTLYRWLTLPHFQEKLQQEREKLREQAFDNLKATLNKAVERLGELLDDESSSVRLRACQTILDYNIKLVEIQELEERLARLEALNK